MKPYVFSLGAGLLIGVIYSLLNVRSPAPPAIALLGLMGILLGEQALPVAKRLFAGQDVAALLQPDLAPRAPDGPPVQKPEPTDKDHA